MADTYHQYSSGRDPREPPVRAASQQDHSFQVILSGIPADVTVNDIVDALKSSYGVEHIVVSIRHDNTAIVNGLSSAASNFLISLRTITIVGCMVKTIFSSDEKARSFA